MSNRQEHAPNVAGPDADMELERPLPVAADADMDDEPEVMYPGLKDKTGGFEPIVTKRDKGEKKKETKSPSSKKKKNKNNGTAKAADVVSDTKDKKIEIETTEAAAAPLTEEQKHLQDLHERYDFSKNTELYSHLLEIEMLKADDKPVPFSLMNEAQTACKGDKDALDIFWELAGTVKILKKSGEVTTLAELSQKKIEAAREALAKEKKEKEDAVRAKLAEEAKVEKKADKPTPPNDTLPPKNIQQKAEQPKKPEIEKMASAPVKPNAEKPAPRKTPDAKTPEQAAAESAERRRSNENKLAHQLEEAQSKTELEAVIRQSEFLDGGIEGSDKGIYSRQDLLVQLDGLWKGEIGIDNLTKGCGFRAAAYRIYVKTKHEEPKTYAELQSHIEKKSEEEVNLPEEMKTYSKGAKGEPVYTYNREVLGSSRPPRVWQAILKTMLGRFRQKKAQDEKIKDEGGNK